MFARLFVAAALVPVLLVPATPAPAVRGAAPVVFQIDPAHSGVSFQIRHFVSKVRGNFKDVKGTITASPDAWQDAVIDVTIATASISTANDRRDAHLRSPDFFAADSFPTITFRSTRVERTGDDARIHGNLTLRGVTRPVVLTGRFTGIMAAAQGQRVGFEASTTVNRLDYGVKYNRAVEGGGVMLGDEVTVDIEVEAVSGARR
ncbi:MAG: polyisoprenoid-binding protein [Gemmatimonadetes bacterium]|jgi:polyisoprenoid-binding protein YceI|nr:polyisoprenoid-binding protein [Gemmatimonadota bacterium]